MLDTKHNETVSMWIGFKIIRCKPKVHFSAWKESSFWWTIWENLLFPTGGHFSECRIKAQVQPRARCRDCLIHFKSFCNFLPGFVSISQNSFPATYQRKTLKESAYRTEAKALIGCFTYVGGLSTLSSCSFTFYSDRSGNLSSYNTQRKIL